MGSPRLLRPYRPEAGPIIRVKGPIKGGTEVPAGRQSPVGLDYCPLECGLRA